MNDQRKNLTTYSAMGDSCTDYEAYSGTTPFQGFVGLHCHDFYEFYLFFYGIDYYCLGESVYHLKPGTLLIIPPFLLHGPVGFQEPTHYRRAWLYISTALMQRLGLGQIDLRRNFQQCARAGRLRYEMNLPDAEQLRQLIEEIAAGMGDDSAKGKWRTISYLTDFVRSIFQAMEQDTAISAPVMINETIQHIVTHVNEHFTEALTLPVLARQFGVSVSYLSHEFVAYTGHSVYDYVLYRRVQLAKEMICSGTPLAEIAYACGFNDYSGFLRAFVRLSGLTPSAYRKRLKEMPGGTHLQE